MKKLTTFLIITIFFLILHPCKAEEGKFMVVDIVIDSSDSTLAAYQVELSWDKDKVKIVGIEGGEKPYENPPYYDSSAFNRGRIILAAFLKDGSKAKSGKVLVAKLHILSETGKTPEIETKLIAACKSDGKRFRPRVTIKINQKALKSDEKTE